MEQGREPTITQPTYGVNSGNQIQATLVGGGSSHHCSIPAPEFLHLAFHIIKKHCPVCFFATFSFIFKLLLKQPCGHLHFKIGGNHLKGTESAKDIGMRTGGLVFTEIVTL